MESKRRNMFHKNKKQETTEIGGYCIFKAQNSKGGQMGGCWTAGIAIVLATIQLSSTSSKLSIQTTAGVGQPGTMNVTRRTSPAYHEVRLQCNTGTNENADQGNLTWIFVGSTSITCDWCTLILNFLQALLIPRQVTGNIFTLQGAEKPCWPEKECQKKLSWSGREMCGDGGCGPVLVLAKPTHASQGLYTCYRVHGSRGFFINTPLVSYLLQIIGNIMMSYFLAPEGRGSDDEAIVESPKEVKVRAPSEAVLRCQVTLPSKGTTSKKGLTVDSPIKVHWFKLITDQQSLRPLPTHIRYMDQLYQLLNSTTIFRSISHSNVYQSRLTLRRTTMEDSGLYVCGVLTDTGIRYTRTVLTVLTEDIDDKQDTSTSKEMSHKKNSLWEVFSSVVVFVLCVIFACCWTLGICCYKMFQQAFKQPTTTIAEQSERELEHTTHLARPREIHMDIIGSETSDYEHIVTV
ncbi:hypothetical protein AAG570_009603 [Ranatra chinensis]|uniref:Ig-like domain-containing protein n=1 Tax=Ranatra chinensis TaxID=642074 RepID=A0ABD0Z6P2_9HEMI